jgi:hypothetical protein
VVARAEDKRLAPAARTFHQCHTHGIAIRPIQPSPASNFDSHDRVLRLCQCVLGSPPLGCSYANRRGSRSLRRVARCHWRLRCGRCIFAATFQGKARGGLVGSGGQRQHRDCDGAVCAGSPSSDRRCCQFDCRRLLDRGGVQSQRLCAGGVARVGSRPRACCIRDGDVWCLDHGQRDLGTTCGRCRIAGGAAGGSGGRHIRSSLHLAVEATDRGGCGFFPLHAVAGPGDNSRDRTGPRPGSRDGGIPY